MIRPTRTKNAPRAVARRARSAANCDRAAATARRLSEEARRAPEAWENQNLPDSLEALGGRLDDCRGYYANQRRVLPSNAWQIVDDALRAATIYE